MLLFVLDLNYKKHIFQLNKLLELQWWNYSDEKLKNNISFFQTEDITIEKIEELEKLLR